jgi:hypothetical protein
VEFQINKLVQEPDQIINPENEMDVHTSPRGSRLFKHIEIQGRLLKDTSDGNTDFSTNIIPKIDMEAFLLVLIQMFKALNYCNWLQHLRKLQRY